MGTPLRFFSDDCWITPTHTDDTKPADACALANDTSRLDAGRPPETAKQTKTTAQTDTTPRTDTGKRVGTTSPDRSLLPRRGRWRRTVRHVGACARSAPRCVASNGPFESRAGASSCRSREAASPGQPGWTSGACAEAPQRPQLAAARASSDTKDWCRLLAVSGDHGDLGLHGGHGVHTGQGGSGVHSGTGVHTGQGGNGGNGMHSGTGVQADAERSAPARSGARITRVKLECSELAEGGEGEALFAKVRAALQRDQAIAKLSPGAPKPIVVVEITNKVLGDLFTLRPDRTVDDIILGVLGRALEQTGEVFYGGHVLSNHLSMLVGVVSCHQLATFTHRLFQQTSHRVRRHLGLNTPLWACRYHGIVLSGDEATQAHRAKYCLANGTKEHLVVHPSRWPGIHSARLFCNGEQMVGHWTNFTAFGRAKRRNPNACIEDHQTKYVIAHTKLPCFAHLSNAEYTALQRRWCDEVAEEAAAERRERGQPEPGDPAALCRIDRGHRPDQAARSPQPAIHTLDPAVKRRHREAYKAYVAQHQALRAELRAHLVAKGLALPGGLPPTGWVPVVVTRAVASSASNQLEAPNIQT